MKDARGITLIVLIVTIIILLILAGITVSFLTGENGLLNKAKNAQEENRKQTATEVIKLKITDAQIQSYQNYGTMPNLQYLADRLCEDNEIAYVNLEKQKISAINEKISVGENTSIYTKLEEYPYEFEINQQFEIISINGSAINENEPNFDFTNSEEYQQMLETINQLKGENEQLKQTNNQIKGENEQLKQVNQQIQSQVNSLKQENEQLKKNRTKMGGIFLSWKEATGWNEAGLFRSMRVDNTLCTQNTNNRVTIQESGHYLISMLSYNTSGGGTPRFQLYRNNVCIKDYANNSARDNCTKATIEIELNKGDVFYGKMNGGGSNPTIFLTSFEKVY